MCVVLDKRRKLKLAIGMCVGCRGHLPDFEFTTEANCEVATGGREGERGDRRLERKMVDSNAPGNIGQYGLAIFVNGEEEVSLGGEPYPRNVLSVCEGKGVGLVAAARRVSNAKRIARKSL
jgi:hypothetical protein